MAILFLGASSEIARQNVRIFHARGERLILAARSLSVLESFADQLFQEHSGKAGISREQVFCLTYDARKELASFSDAEKFWNRCRETAKARWNEEITGIYAAQGFLPANDSNVWGEETESTIFLNFTSLALFLEAAAKWFEENPQTARGAWISVLSSVAGERGRWSNYPYGAAKAGLTAWLSGLRARLHPLGILVQTVKPGLVKTRMIANRPQENSRTAADPQKIARSVDRAISARRDVVYVPGWWRFVMLCVRLLPEWLFKRMKF